MSDVHDKPQSLERIPERELARMSPLAARALDILERNPSPETLRELLKVQREWEADEARKAYAAAFIGLKSDLPTTVKHDKKVDFHTTHYTYASLSQLVEAVTPHLNNHGLVLTWKTARPKHDEVRVTCQLMHRAGHCEIQEASAAPDPKGGKNDAQAFESTCTTLKRQSLLAALGMATAPEEDSEGGDDEELLEGKKVDTDRNLAAVGKLRKLGKTCEQAEKIIGKPVSEWTVADLKRLELWAKPTIKHASDCAVNAPDGGAACDCGAAK